MNLKLYIALLSITVVCVSSHPNDDIIEEDYGKTAQMGGTGSFFGGNARKLTAAALGLIMSGSAALAHAARPAPGPGPDAGFGPGPVQRVDGLWQPPQHVPAPMYPGNPVHTELERQYLRQLGISELPHSRAYALQQHRPHKKLQESEGEHKIGKSSRRRKTGKRRVLTDLPPLQGDLAVHDPTLVHAFGKWVLYSSHNGIEERESDDLITWSRPTSDNAAFKNPPAWIDRSDIISPDVSGPYSDGMFRMYYAVENITTGGTHEPTTAIGMATSPSGRPGSWLDHGIVISSKESDPYHAMDPNLFVDTGSGRWWLTFGAAQKGIFQVELDPKTGMPLDDAVPTNIAKGPNGDGAESPSLIEKDGWYYLFLSFGSHDDTSSTNTIRYGYSKSPQGPFTDRNYMPMTEGYGTMLYGGNDVQKGPGGQTVVRAGDKDVMAYHYYDSGNNGAVTLGMKYLNWTTNGWPFLVELRQ